MGREAIVQDSPTSALGRGRSQQTEQRFSPDETNLFHFLSSESDTANYCFTFEQTGCRLFRRLNPASETRRAQTLMHMWLNVRFTQTHTMWRCVSVPLCVCLCGIRITAGKTFKPVNLSGATGDRIEAPRLNDAGLFLCVARIKSSSVNALKHPLTGHRISGETRKKSKPTLPCLSPFLTEPPCERNKLMRATGEAWLEL